MGKLAETEKIALIFVFISEKTIRIVNSLSGDLKSFQILEAGVIYTLNLITVLF